jgi:hyaluronoglucosaminidase
MFGERQFLTGIIEGFYGQPWSFETRLAYADYLQLLDLDTYIYCPKADPYLRKRWQERWPVQRFQEMKVLADAYANRSLAFGVGLSPFEVYKNYDSTQKRLLRGKVGEINELGAPLLAILFDDMPGDMPSLAARQLDIINDIAAWSNAERMLVCPTYYSLDPVLEKYFGPMPEHYWGDLGLGLSREIDILWTGNKVCSESVSAADIAHIQLQLARPIVLWDNYPVNDGALRSNFLYGGKLRNRDPHLATALTGHLCNPMNQGCVSLLALQGLSELYGRSTGDLSAVIGSATLSQLALDTADFQQLGLSGLGAQRRQQLSQAYAALPGPAAAEVVAWLRGEYTFDPACLTD